MPRRLTFPPVGTPLTLNLVFKLVDGKGMPRGRPGRVLGVGWEGSLQWENGTERNTFAGDPCPGAARQLHERHSPAPWRETRRGSLASPTSLSFQTLTGRGKPAADCGFVQKETVNLTGRRKLESCCLGRDTFSNGASWSPTRKKGGWGKKTTTTNNPKLSTTGVQTLEISEEKLSFQQPGIDVIF